MKKIRKILCIVIFAFLFILIGTIKSNAGSLSMSNMDFTAQINEDGSMDVTEIWNINISNTNTLYKTFEKDSEKYSGITNVLVTDITNDNNQIFKETSEWAYHVTKGCYYGTENKEGDFEIGWGVGLDNGRDKRKYKISYKVHDVITKYNDYAELYWQFIGKDFEINCKKVTGIIYLPKDVSNKDEIKVWGHTKDLNGTIYATDSNKIEFEVNNYTKGRFVEVRTLFPTNLISYAKRTKNKDVLASVVKEEAKWANKANAERKRNEFLSKYLDDILRICWIIINVTLVIIFIKKAIKYKKELKELNKYIPTQQLEYYRELPDENATPGEAVKILKMELNSFTPANFGKIFSATMLDLTLKEYLEINQDSDNKKKVEINILKRDYSELKSDEKSIFNFILSAAQNNDKITLKELEKYIKNHPSKVEKLLKNSYELTNTQLIEQEIIDKEVQKEYNKYKTKKDGYIVAIFALFCMTFILFIIPMIIFAIDASLCSKITKKLNVLTQKGVDAQEQWKGLKKYMEDFSLLDRREVPELVIWEKYLVFATAFGIADRVIKQLKIVYPDLADNLGTSIGTYHYMNVIMNTDFNTSFSNAISSSISSAYSSGSGGGGGFSGGGGGGRRPEVAGGGR